MKNFKRMLALLMVAALSVASFSACGDEEQTTAAADSGETTEAAQEGGTFVIGGIGPITGPAAVYGIAVQRGAQIAIDEINAAGGVNGMTLALDFQDDEHDAEKSVNAYNTIKDNGAKVLLGTVTSTPCEAVVEKTFEDGMFQITPSGSSVNAICHENAFRICFSDPSQGTAAAQYIKGTLGLTKAAVIYDNSDVYSSGIYEKFATEAQAQGIEIVSAQAFSGADNKDFNTQLIAINDAQPEIVFLPIYYQAAALILQQSQKAGYSFTFFGCDGLDGVIGQLEGDAALAEGVMLLTPFVADDPAENVQSFVQAYQAAYGEVPNQFAADAYDGIYVIKAALEQAQITDPTMSVSDIGTALIEAIKTITVEGITGTMKWTEDGECDKTPKGMVIKDGVYTAITQ
ncbi:MAG: ABC transporter substrate-binding protein [Lachnospiraceae bacterium]|nr:ABC transporter substrate-binding protein [Lachnospiraceae bacterium]